MAGSGHLVRPGLMAGAGLSLMSVGLVVIAMVPVAWAAFIGFGITGAGFSGAVSDLNHVVQVRSDRRYLGRVMSWWLLAFLGSRPLSSLLLGTMADALSARTACVVAAGIAMLLAMASTVVVLRSPRIRDRPVRPVASGPPVDV